MILATREQAYFIYTLSEAALRPARLYAGALLILALLPVALAGDTSPSRPVVQVPIRPPFGEAQFSPDGKRFAFASVYSGVMLCDTATGRLIDRIAPGEKRFHYLAYAPSGTEIACGGTDGSLFVWDLNTGDFRRIYKAESSRTSIVYSPDGKLIALGELDVTVIERQTGQVIARLKGDRTVIGSLAFSPDGSMLAIGNTSGALHLWRRQDKAFALVKSAALEQAEPIYSLWFHPDGRQLIIRAEASGPLYWDTRDDSRPLAPPELKDLWQWTTSPDWRTAVSTTGIGWMLFSLPSHPQRTVEPFEVAAEPFEQDLRPLVISPAGDYLLTTTLDEEAIHRWKPRSGKRLEEPVQIQGWSSELQLANNGRDMLSISVNVGMIGKPIVWDVTAGTGTRTIGPSGSALHFKGAKSSNRTLRVRDDVKVEIWDLGRSSPTSSVVAPFDELQELAVATAISPDGKVVAAGGMEKTQLWRVNGNRPTPIAQIVPGGHLLEFTPSGEGLFVSNARSLRLYSSRTGKKLEEFGLLAVDEKTGYQSLAVDPHSGGAVLGRSDGKLVLRERGARTARWEVEAHNDPVYYVAVSADGRRVASSGDYKIKLWESATGRLLATFAVDEAGGPIQFDRRGQLWVGTNKGGIDVWSLDKEIPRRIVSLYSFTDGTWAAVDPDGHYDGNRDGLASGLFYAADRCSPPKPAMMSGMRRPGLLQRLLKP